LTTPPEKIPENISGKIVIISNLIQLQQAVRRIDDHRPGLPIDPDQDALRQGDIDLPAPPSHDEEGRPAGLEDPRDLPDFDPVPGHDPAAEELEVVEQVRLEPPEHARLHEQLTSGQGVRRGQGVDPLELEVEGIAVPLERFDGERFEPSVLLDVDRPELELRGSLLLEPDLDRPVAPLAPDDPAQADEFSLFR
jgi:hypothetical protein